MKEIEKLVLQKILITLKLQKALMEYGNKYVFGFDDVDRIMRKEIADLD